MFAGIFQSAIPAHGLRILYNLCRRCLDGQYAASFVAFESPHTLEGAPPWAPSRFQSFPARSCALVVEPERITWDRTQQSSPVGN
jgi:hypothetical protein